MNDPNKIDLLAVRNETFLRDVQYHEVTESTNKLGMELAKSMCEIPSLIIAEQQTAGRGRSNNVWWSEAGALTFSLLLELPVRDVADIGPFSLTVGLAICQALERLSPAADLALKWPNDVYFNERKISGVLIERPLADEPRLVVGVGVNVNNSLKQAPESLQQTATSLVDQLDSPQSLTDLLISFVTLLEQLTRDHLHARDHLLDQWRAYCMLTGRHISVDQAGTQLSGVCRGVDSQGALLLETPAGTERVIAGTVTRF